MKVAVGPNSHGNEVFERLVVDPQGNLLRVPHNARLKEGWSEATDAEVATATKAAEERADQERKNAEKAHEEKRKTAQAQLTEGGPLLVRTADNQGQAVPRRGETTIGSFGEDVRPVPQTRSAGKVDK